MAGGIRVGTASWADPGFVRDWYPPHLPSQQRLAWYAQHFGFVELNSSFYAVPERSLVERWERSTPPGFLFDVKLHKSLSRHAFEAGALPRTLQRMARSVRGRAALTPELEEALAAEFLHAVEPLEEAGKFGAFLLQLSPAFSPGNTHWPSWTRSCACSLRAQWPWNSATGTGSRRRTTPPFTLRAGT